MNVDNFVSRMIFDRYGRPKNFCVGFPKGVVKSNIGKLIVVFKSLYTFISSFNSLMDLGI